jgi:hypothetical protein
VQGYERMDINLHSPHVRYLLQLCTLQEDSEFRETRFRKSCTVNKGNEMEICDRETAQWGVSILVQVSKEPRGPVIGTV